MAHLPVADSRAIFGCDAVLCRGRGRGHQTGVAFLAAIDLVTSASSVGRCTRRGSVVNVGATDDCIRALPWAMLVKVSIFARHPVSLPRLPSRLAIPGE